MFRRLFWLICGLALLGMIPAALAQTIPDSGRVVAVLFYSPTCPYCHIVIDDHLPRIQAQFGDQLEVLLVNVQAQAGAAIYHQACAALDTGGVCGGVPLMAVGSRLLMGAQDIPNQMPAIVAGLLTSGGLSLPAFPEMPALYASWQQSAGRSAAISAFAAPPSVFDRLAADPEGNAAAVVVLVGLVVSLVVVIATGTRGTWEHFRYDQPALLMTTGATVLVAGSLALNAAADDPFAAFSAWGVLLLALVGLLVITRPNWRARVGLPLAALIGLGAAAYLSYVEVGSAEAACGLIGNCNAVQQSAYARVLGVPVGVLGVIGYGLLLGTWLLARVSAGARQMQLEVAVLAMALGGVAFSAYLTFLEPFVIGATCAWCLLSALAMLLILWLAAPSGWRAYHARRQPHGRSKAHGRDGSRPYKANAS
ncbi:vitamin K epoxide reductase family protein [Aggregatilineales bacterium SYSU G02658]